MKYVLAPLAEYTDAAFRRLCVRHGADLVYTEMVSATALFHGSAATRQMMVTFPDEGPVACQAFGHRPEELAAVAAEVEKSGRFVELNLNAGCPMPRIVREGDGAALVNDPQLVHDCLAAMARETSLPVTLKTRPGPRPDRVRLFELLDAAESAGAAGLALHARFTSQMHGGDVHLDLIAELVRRAHVPITGNGGVRTPADAARMAETGVAAIMVGRGAFANPQIFRELKGGAPADAAERLETFKDHVALILELQAKIAREFPEGPIPSVDGLVNVTLHRHMFRYFNGLPGAAEFRRRLGSIRTLRETMALVDEFTSALGKQA